MIETSEQGNDIVDRINACEKRYLMGKMCVVDNPEADDSESRMNAHSMI